MAFMLSFWSPNSSSVNMSSLTMNIFLIFPNGMTGVAAIRPGLTNTLEYLLGCIATSP